MKEKLKELIGYKYNYKGNNIIIEDVKFIGTNIVVKTELRVYNLLESQIQEFMENLQEPKQEKGFDLKTFLIETIQRVKSDPGFVKQANSICSLSSQLINIEKLKNK